MHNFCNLTVPSACKRVFLAVLCKKKRKKAIVFAFLHQRWLHVGAADEARTRYLHLGKVALYQMSYGRIRITLFCVIGAPAKICEAKVCGEKEKVSQDFRRGASDRNRTNDTGIFSPLLYRLSYRGITGAFVPAPSRILMNRGPRKDLQSRGLWGRGGISAFAWRSCVQDCQANRCHSDEATRIGLEPTTPSVTGWCSNQLSYRATWWKLTGSNR